jgi:hypothetical protein
MLPIITLRFEKHWEIKQDLIEILESQTSAPVVPDPAIQDQISKTDWYVDINVKRPYWDFLCPTLLPVLKDTYENRIGYDQWSVGEYWFQIYETGDSHEWHFHPGCLYNNIYYVELEDGSPRTELMAPVTGEVIIPEVEEGDILIFPSVFRHRSPKNLGLCRKTIVSWNVI